MGLHEVATVAGVTEACRYNDHSMCNNPSCSCDCHHKVTLAPPIDDMTPANPENACPTCGVKRPATELFCRIDGSRLTSLACNMCGRGMNPEDHYCFHCGAPKGQVKLAQVMVTGPPMEVDEAEILKGLQEELSGTEESVVASVPKQTVVEQPGGTQGSFKLVSQPNPNKIRGPLSQGNSSRAPRAPIRPSIKLPIKPQ